MPTTVRVLVADPSPTSCEQTAKQFLGRPGVEIVQVRDGATTLAALRDEDIDIALIDRTMPGIDGRSVVEWVVEGGRRCLLLLTATRLTERWHAVSSYVSAYDTLLKPIRRARVDTVLETYRRLQIPSRALVVNDTVGTSRTMAGLLRRSRFEFSIEECDGGRRGVALAAAERFDVALVALRLQDLPGMEVSIEMNEGPNTPRIVLVGGPGDRARMSDATLAMFGAHAYVRMPFALHQLDAALHTAFGLWRPYLAKALSRAQEAAAA